MHTPANLLLVHYDEIGVKGRNRGAWEDVLRRNLVRAMPAGSTVVRARHRFEVRGAGAEGAAGAQRVFGVAHVTAVVSVPARIDVITAAAVDLAVERQATLPAARTFVVRARRSHTAFATPSPDVERHVGSAVGAALAVPVDLTAPELVVRVEVVADRAYVGVDRSDGPGGLPVGVSGRVVCLLSGGIDSPVATWRLLRRGVDPVVVHCHGRPFTDASSERSAAALVAVLAGWGLRLPWWSVPIGEAQRALLVAVPAPWRVLVQRRLMLRVAEVLAAREGARALATGDSIGQVASQTLANLAAVDAATTLPVLRPLVGDDKQEIVARARAIGTYDISATPHEDCCTLLAAHDPVTRGSVRALDEVEAGLDVPALVEACLAGAVARDPVTGGSVSGEPVTIAPLDIAAVGG